MAVDESVTQIIYDKLQKNPKLIKLLKAAGAKEELLMLSDFMSLYDPETKITYPDSNVFDGTNEAHTGGWEDKTFADAVGSLTGADVVKKRKKDGTYQVNCPKCGDGLHISIEGDNITQKCLECNTITNSVPKYKWEWVVNEGLYHLWKQVIKMYSTGLPWCIIVYGSRYIFQKKSGVSDELVLQAILKLVAICTIYNGQVYTSIKNEHEAVESIRTFLKKSPEMPRRWPIYNLFKRVEEDQVAMHCGITGFGIEIPRAIAGAGHRPCDIGYDAKRVELGETTADEFEHKYGGSRKADKLTKVEGMGLEKARTLFKAYTNKWVKDDPK